MFPVTGNVGNHETFFTFSSIYSRDELDLEADLTSLQVSFRLEMDTQESTP